MKSSLRKNLLELSFFSIISMGLVTIAHAQTTEPQTDIESPQKRVRVEVEITENGKTSTSIQEMELNRESINGQLEEMVEEIEMILEEAVQDVEETDLEITIKRNTIATPRNLNPHYRTYMSVIPESPTRRGVEDRPMAFLGVYAEPLDDSELEELGLSQAVRLSNVVEESAADKAGLNSGDVIKTIGGQQVGDFAELARVIRSHKPGETVQIEVIREGVPKTIEATLEENVRRHYKFKSTPKPFLGVRGRDENGGALIETVITGSAAEDAGVQPSDVITGVDDVQVTSFESLGEALRSREIGQQVELKVIRNDEEISLNATLGSKSPEVPQVLIYGNGNNHNRGYQYNYNYDYDYDFEYEDWDEKAFLGIVGRSGEDGVEVTKVFEGTSAEKMSLEEGDVIKALDGKKIQDVDDLVDHLDNLEPGDDLKVTYIRDGNKMKESVSLGDKSEYKKLQNTSCNQVKRIVMRVEVEELDEKEINDLANKSGESLDATNSLALEELQFSPNPTTGQFKIMFDLPEEGDTDIRVFDQNGQLVVTQELKDFTGIYSNQFDISDQPAGVYFISITQNGKGRTSRVIKQ